MTCPLGAAAHEVARGTVGGVVTWADLSESEQRGRIEAARLVALGGGADAVAAALGWAWGTIDVRARAYCAAFAGAARTLAAA